MWTKREFDKLTHDGRPGAYIVNEPASVKGFGVKLYPTGEKSFVLRFTWHKTRHTETIGQASLMSLDTARAKAKEAALEIKGGVNPFAFEVNPRDMTWSRFKDVYMTEHGRHKKSGEKDRKRIDKHIVPQWGNLPLKALNRDAVASYFREVGKDAPYEANRFLSLLSKMWSVAIDCGLIGEDSPNPAKRIKRFKETKRERFISAKEMPVVREAIAGEASPYVRALFILYMLTGVRKVALMSTKWEDVNLTDGTLTLAETKAGRRLHVPLSKEAVEAFKSVPRQIGNPYVFCSDVAPLTHVKDVKKAWARIKERTKAREVNIDDVRIHDLRRTFGSWLASNGVSIATIMELMDISQHSTAKVYMRFQQEALRDAVNLVSGKMGKA